MLDAKALRGIAARFSRNEIDCDDLVGAAALAMVCKPPRKGYERKTARNAMIDYLRHNLGRRRQGVFDELRFEPAVYDPEPTDLWPWLQTRIDPRLYRVLCWRYVEGRTIKEVGERLGVSQPRASQLHTVALESVREVMSVGNTGYE